MPSGTSGVFLKHLSGGTVTPKMPEPWWREDRQSWFVQIDRKRFNLGRNKKQAYQR